MFQIPAGVHHGVLTETKGRAILLGFIQNAFPFQVDCPSGCLEEDLIPIGIGFFFFWQDIVAKSNVSDLRRALFSKSASRQVATVKVDSLAVIKILSTKL